MRDWRYATPRAPHGSRRSGLLRLPIVCAAVLVSSCRQAVALDWKWLFIYPDQGVAAVNQLVVPVGTPIHFRLTSATVMNSFFIPQLGSQIYTMGGMTTHLNLLADKPGEYPGFSANYSGDGFADMRFTVNAVLPGDFDKWIAQAHGAGSSLDPAGYAALAKPSKAVPPATFGSVEGNLL